MPIASYLVFPEAGKISQVRDDLELINGCETVTAENRELLILVTSSASLKEDQELQKKIESVPNIQCLALVAGHDDSEADKGE